MPYLPSIKYHYTNDMYRRLRLAHLMYCKLQFIRIHTQLGTVRKSDKVCVKQNVEYTWFFLNVAGKKNLKNLNQA